MSSEAIRVRVGCEFTFDVAEPSPALIQVAPRAGDSSRIADETWELRPAADLTSFVDLYGNHVRRAVLGQGQSRLRYDAAVEVPHRPDQWPGSEAAGSQHEVEDLPGEVMHFLLASRYCLSDVLMQPAWDLFGESAPGWERAIAICDWVHRHLRFRYGASDQTTTAKDVFDSGEGVCRDFAHLFISLCRAMNIPARYAFGYLPDIDITPSHDVMDFAAWSEVYLGGRWWTLDPRNNRARVGRVLIGRGRDAADVSMVTTWGPASIRGLQVWAAPEMA